MCRLLFPNAKKCNELFELFVLEGYAHTNLKISIVFRVSGKVRDFISEVPERLRFLKKNSEITIDLVFPESTWKGISQEKNDDEIKQDMVECFQIRLKKAEDIGKLINKAELQRDLQCVMENL